MAAVATPTRNAALRGSTAGRRGVPATVTLRRTALDDLHDELTAERAESGDFAARVRLGATRITAAAMAGSSLAVVNEAGKLGYLADRRLRQVR